MGEQPRIAQCIHNYKNIYSIKVNISPIEKNILFLYNKKK